MVLPRPSVRWSQFCKQSFRTGRGSAYRRTGQQFQRRAYASEGGGDAHGAHKSGSDLPWAITSAVVTIPCVWYLLQPQLNASGHGEGHGHGGHDEHEGDSEKHEEGEGVESEEGGESDKSNSEGQSEEQQGKEDEEGGGSDGGESLDSGSEDGQDTPQTSDDEDQEDSAHEKEGGGNTAGVQFKAPTSGGSKEGEQGDTRKHIPDAKGYAKKRIESDYGKQLGESEDEETDPKNKDLAAASKPAGGKNTQSGKQEGLSNTNTKHSTDIANDPEKSKKGEGMPETAKSKGTVDPHRAQGEDEEPS